MLRVVSYGCYRFVTGCGLGYEMASRLQARGTVGTSRCQSRDKVYNMTAFTACSCMHGLVL